MSTKASFYFVLYLIGIVNLLAIVTERDYAVDKLAKGYREPLKISVPGVSEWREGEAGSFAVLISNLKSAQERSSVKYHLVPLSDSDAMDSLSPTPTIESETGDAVFDGMFRKAGEYRFKVWADVTRNLPKDAGGQRIVTSSDTVTFAVRVSARRHEIPGTKFSMGVDKKFERWISGVPYYKTVFMNTDPRKVHLAGVPSGFRRGVVGENSIQLVWDLPMPGRTEVALTGNAGRSLSAELDAARLEFAVSVAPPAWNPAPQKSAYWNIPYSFASRVGELDANDYVVKVFANETTPVQTVSGKQFPLIILPERTWSSLTFVAVSNGGHEMLRATVSVKTPPPPQIKWTSSRLEGDDYVISFAAEDVGGKDANVNCAIVSPKGLTGVLSARHGKAFTFTIRNVTETHPQAITVRTSIHGIGGVSTPLDRTFPILY